MKSALIAAVAGMLIGGALALSGLYVNNWRFWFLLGFYRILFYVEHEMRNSK